MINRRVHESLEQALEARIHSCITGIGNTYSIGAAMRLTAFTDYGLRALMRLVGEPERVFTTDEIASEFAISRNHLTKVVRELAEAGFVVTHRGAGGGLRLARPAGSISIGDVVRRLEARHPIVECFRTDGGNCVLTPQCRLKGRLASARNAFLAELEKSSLAECAYPARRSVHKSDGRSGRRRQSAA
jgi:Rrf2 family nitric oxide-sensitive transcriptional repressor